MIRGCLEVVSRALRFSADHPVRFLCLLGIIAIPRLPSTPVATLVLVVVAAIAAIAVIRLSPSSEEPQAPLREKQAEALIVNMSQHMGRWSSTSEESGSELRLARGEVATVIDDIHDAVITIGTAFRGVMKKTAVQRELAMKLLSTVAGAAAAGEGTRAAIEDIDKLGKEINADIGRIVVAMQFQDITQQRLERVHQPVLNRVIQELRTVATESCHLRQEASQLVGPADGTGTRTAPTLNAAGSRDPADGRTGAASIPPVQAAVAFAGKGNDVELF